MKRALLAVGAVLILAAPALADEVTIDKRTSTTTTTTTTTPEVGSTVSSVVIAPNPPPPPRVEAPPPPPGPGVVWMRGHWMWHPHETTYIWVHGRYAEPPRAHAAWVPGHWAERSDGWEWVEGHWD